MGSLKRSPLLRWTLGLAVVCVLVIGLLHAKLSLRLARLQRPYIYDNPYLVPSAQTVEATALNYRPAAADLVWIAGVGYVGQSFAAHRPADDATRFARVIIHLDPYFYRVYQWHSAARITLAGHLQSEDIAAANDILDIGSTYFPDDWKLPYEVAVNYIGFTYAYHLDRAKRLHQLEDAREHAAAAASKTGAPEIASLLAMSFQRKYDRLQTGHSENNDTQTPLSEADIKLLRQLYVASPSRKVHQIIEQRLQRHNRSGEVDADLKAFQNQLRRRWGRSTHNYVPLDMYTLLAVRDPDKIATERPSLTRN